MENSKIQSNEFLGTGKVKNLLLKFSVPCVLSLIIQALYNLVDQIYIGHSPELGAIGNAATGIVYPLTVIALGIGLWLGDGAAACMSINQGRNNAQGSSKSVGTAFTIGTLSGILMTILVLCLKTPILQAIGGSGVVLDAAVEYSVFISIGFTFFILACVLNPIIRADGSPKYAMLAMAVGAVLNIILDPIFIYACGMGMTGAALATFLGQTLTFAMHFIYLFRSKTFRVNIKDFIPSCKHIGELLKFGISSFLTQIAIVIISIVNNILLGIYSASSGYDIMVTQGVITLAFKVFGIVVSIIVGIASGGQPIVGYNYGAKKYDRVKQTYKFILIATVIVGIIATILFEACPTLFLLIFGDGGSSVDKTMYSNFTALTFRIYLGFILLTCVTKVTAIFMQSIGKPVKAAVISMGRDVVFLVPPAILMCVFGGVDLLLWSAPIADVLAFILSAVLVVSELKRMPEQENRSEEEIDNSIASSVSGRIITIAREHGTKGRAIGEAVAKKLGIPFYDKTITALVAEQSGLAKEFVESINEGEINLAQSLYIGLEPSSQAALAQNKVLNAIAQNGACVIVGRCADYVLKEFKPLKVFICAPKEYRIKKISEMYGDNEIQAAHNIEKSDKRRAAYYNMITSQEWGMASNYDLSINSDIGVQASANLIVEYLKSSEK